MHNLIQDLFVKFLNNPILKQLTDSAVLSENGDIAFTTDSFVINPLKFPGGDIGKLSICGTVNDLVMLGARPQYISLGLIIEEGLDYLLLESIIRSISKAARSAGVLVVTGDTKVVEKGSCDKIFINTSGIGKIIHKKKLSLRDIKVGDRIIVTGNIAEHGLAVLSARRNLNPEFNIKSDCAALDKLILPVLEKTPAIRFMRDPTRGGLAGVLNEIVLGSGLGIAIEEKKIPLSSKVKAASELLGIDPLYIANEGKAVLIVEEKSADKILRLLQKNSLGRNSAIIGTITDRYKKRVVLNTLLGTQHISEFLNTEQLPRIC